LTLSAIYIANYLNVKPFIVKIITNKKIYYE